MAGAFYPGDVFWQALAGTPSHLALAPLAPFTVWTDQASGSKLTNLTALDGITALATDGTPGNYLSGSDSLRPDLRSPDQSGILWCDTGTHRYPMLPIDVLALLLQNGARLNDVGTQQFVGQIDFAVAPTILGAPIGTGGGGGSYTDEQARDAVGAALVQSGYVSIVVDDAGNTITISTTSALATALNARLTTPTFTANQGMVAFNKETSGGTYDALPANIGTMSVIWIGADDPLTGTRGGDMRYRIP